MQVRGQFPEMEPAPCPLRAHEVQGRGSLHREEPTRKTPETVIRPELPPAAWILVAEPDGRTTVLASTENAALEARAHLSKMAADQLYTRLEARWRPETPAGFVMSLRVGRDLAPADTL